MRLFFSAALLACILSSVGSAAFAQSPSQPQKVVVPWKKHCQPNDGFCFRYPGSWKMLGEIFDGNGVVVAPPQREQQAFWDEVTAAMVVPPPQDDKEAQGLDGVIAQASAAMREAGQDFHTLERGQRTVDHKPAEMLRVQYREKNTGRDWVEELVFIEGPDGEIYSVALKCSPGSRARLEPAFAQILRSWSLPEPHPDEQTPAQTSTPPANRAPH